MSTSVIPTDSRSSIGGEVAISSGYNDAHFPFLLLPAEVRNQIYRFLSLKRFTKQLVARDKRVS